MRSFVMIAALCAALPRSAAGDEPRPEPMLIEAWLNVGGTIPLASKWGIRMQGRWVLSSGDTRDAAEASAGLWRKFGRHGSAHLTLGYAYGDDDHALTATLVKNWVRGNGIRTLSYEAEQRLRYDGDPSYEARYRVDFTVIGVHVMHRGTEAIAAGFQVGSGPGYRIARVELQFSFRLKGDLPGRVGACLLTFDLP